MRRMWVRSGLVVLLGSLAVAAPWSARAADYGAQYWPSIAPTPGPAQQASGEQVQTNLQGLTPGATLPFKVSVKNTGTLTWVNTAPNPFALGYSWTGPETVALQVAANLPKATVAPGETVVFNTSIKVPLTPGTYTLVWDMAHVGKTLFSWAGVPTADQLVGVGGPIGFDKGVYGQLAYLNELCKWTDCSGASKDTLACPFGKINSGPKTVRPGKFVYVVGCGFGSDPVLSLRLSNGQTVTVPKESPYGPGLVGGIVPALPDGTQNQGGYLAVKSASGPDLLWPVAVHARVTLPLGPGGIKDWSCSSESDADFCSEGTDGAFIGSHHTAMFSFSVAGDAGEDIVWTITLKNGWVFESMDFQDTGADGWAKASGFDKGTDSQTIRVKFDTTCFTACTAHYELRFTISGPVGTNFK